MPDSQRGQIARDRIVAAAQALLQGSLDALRAAEQIAGAAAELDPSHQDPDLTVFVAIHSETDRYLVIDGDRGWHPHLRESREAEYAAAEHRYRPDALASARTLLARFASRPA
ncbi:MAG: hypothetical protein ACRDIC_10985 [bacterium]